MFYDDDDDDVWLAGYIPW